MVCTEVKNKGIGNFYSAYTSVLRWGFRGTSSNEDGIKAMKYIWKPTENNQEVLEMHQARFYLSIDLIFLKWPKKIKPSRSWCPKIHPNEYCYGKCE